MTTIFKPKIKDKKLVKTKKKRKYSKKEKNFIYQKKKTNYFSYMNSRKWFKKRKLIIEKLGSECQICGKKQNLYLHHKNYKNLGCENKKDLLLVCLDCHAKIHSLIEEKGGINLQNAHIILIKLNNLDLN